MPVRVSLELLRVGHCRHCERMVRADGHWHAVEFPALSVLIRHPQRGALLYDTGYAAHFSCHRSLAGAPVPLDHASQLARRPNPGRAVEQTWRIAG